MAIIAPVAPPTVAPLPTPPSTSDPANFDPRADNFLGALPTNQTQMNALGTNVYNNALKTFNSATDSQVAANAAVPAASTATQAAATASTSLATMQKLYLGAKTTPPFVDNQGNPLELGAWYTNTVTGFWYWWSGSGWKIGVSDLSSVDWGTQVNGKPTTVAGYGITDAVTTNTSQAIAAAKVFEKGTRYAQGIGIGKSDSISDDALGKRSLQISTDTTLGGTLDNHSGCLVYSTMTGAWGGAVLNFAISTNWKTYNTVSPAFKITQSGVTASGDMTSLSDERYKTAWKQIDNNILDKAIKVKYGTYKRDDLDKRQAGVSAQDWLKVLPETVVEDEEGILSVAYGNAAMVLCLELAKELKSLQEEIRQLRKDVYGST